MPRESRAAKQQRAVEMCRRMGELYPQAECALHYRDPFGLVIAVLLSAQTTDVAVNRVTPVLFERWPTPADLAQAPLAEVEEVVHPLGFFRSKARHVVEAAQMVVSDFGGEVPQTMEELARLPGVGRKTANIVLNNAFDIVEGIAVDTHVFRIATRMGFTTVAEPLDAEQDLLELIPSELWKPVNHQWVLFGRQVCDARKPACVAALEVARSGAEGEGEARPESETGGAAKAASKGAAGRSASSKASAKTLQFLDAIGTYPDASGRATWAEVGAGLPCPLADICPSCGKAPQTKAAARKAATAKKAAAKRANAKGNAK